MTKTNYLMIYRMESKNRFILLAAFLLCFLGAIAKDHSKSTMQGIPPRPNPQRLVNNLCGFTGISQEQSDALEAKLKGISDATSNQITVVIMSSDSLYGNDPADFAAEILYQWKVGQAKLDNGIVILLIPDTHKVFISTGYGLEGAIPDATCEEIVQREMIPNFKKGDYNTGLNSAIDVLAGLAKGEYNSSEYAKKGGSQNSKGIGLIFAIIFFLVFFLFSRRNGGKGGMTIGGPGIFFWGGGFGGGGGGFGGGGGGGFGGFGGGSGGGGGAGGSW